MSILGFILLNVFIANAGFAMTQRETAVAPASSASPVSTRQQRRMVPRRSPSGKHETLAFARTELFFGTAKPDGVAVTEAEFRAFVDHEVTPRFPEGLTLRKVDGQFMGEDGMTIKEESYVLILLYPIATQKENNEAIEAIRRLYTSQYQQESVLRVDDPLLVWVSF